MAPRWVNDGMKKRHYAAQTGDVDLKGVNAVALKLPDISICAVAGAGKSGNNAKKKGTKTVKATKKR